MAQETMDRVLQERLSVLEMAAALGNVSEACRLAGMDRTSFYEWRRRFRANGLDGLRNLPPVHKCHPHATVPEVVQRILDLSLAHPLWGCARIAARLRRQRIHISSPTIQNILIKHDLGTKQERILKLEARHLQERYRLSAEQVRHIERANPCFRERCAAPARPGELLVQDTLLIGTIDGIGRVYLQAVVDTYCSYAFSKLHTGKLPHYALKLLQHRVLPFYRQRKITVTAMLTDDSREYCGPPPHPYPQYLSLNAIEHRPVTARQQRLHGFMERFYHTARKEFFEPALDARRYASLATLQADHDRWLKYYNTQRPHHGYRNMSQSPRALLDGYLAQTHDS